ARALFDGGCAGVEGYLVGPPVGYPEINTLFVGNVVPTEEKMRALSVCVLPAFRRLQSGSLCTLVIT
ncbi:MAG: hypothetical protein WA177_02510, partial [Xanthobacteraceae bacterium]